MGETRIEACAKRVRTYLGGQLVADSTHPMLVWELPYYPTYYLPAEDVRAELVPAERHTAEPEHAGPEHARPEHAGPGHAAELGRPTVYDVRLPGATAAGAALRYHDSPLTTLRELVRLDWAAMDEWFEEDEPVYVHPRDPYSRVDILASSRHVVVSVEGVTVADSRQPRILFETGLPPRYYLPLPDVRMDLLRPSPTQTRCPYKGTASYWSVVIGDTVHEDVVWTYRTPVPESQKIMGLACFYNERVDLRVDGVPLERPHTPFS